MVHRLVAITFIPNPLNLPEVNHKDFNKLNNKAENLEWVDRNTNNSHAISGGRMQAHYKSLKGKWSGTKNPKSKLSKEDINNIVDLVRSKTKEKREIAKIFGVDKQTVTAVLKANAPELVRKRVKKRAACTDT